MSAVGAQAMGIYAPNCLEPFGLKATVEILRDVVENRTQYPPP
jgi:hypothetical protein